MTVSSILIVKYIGSFAPYYYLGSTSNGAISGEEGGPKGGDIILCYDEHTGNVRKEPLTYEKIFTLDTWDGEPVVLIQDIEEKLRIARIVYEALMRGGVEDE